MMAWETLDNSTIDKTKEEKQNADDPNFGDAKDNEFDFSGREVEVPGDYAGRANLSENVT